MPDTLLNYSNAINKSFDDYSRSKKIEDLEETASIEKYNKYIKQQSNIYDFKLTKAFQKDIEQIKQITDPSEASTKIGSILNSLADKYSQIGKYDKAKKIISNLEKYKNEFRTNAIKNFIEENFEKKLTEIEQSNLDPFEKAKLYKQKTNEMYNEIISSFTEPEDKVKAIQLFESLKKTTGLSDEDSNSKSIDRNDILNEFKKQRDNKNAELFKKYSANLERFDSTDKALKYINGLKTNDNVKQKLKEYYRTLETSDLQKFQSQLANGDVADLYKINNDNPHNDEPDGKNENDYKQYSLEDNNNSKTRLINNLLKAKNTNSKEEYLNAVKQYYFDEKNEEANSTIKPKYKLKVNDNLLKKALTQYVNKGNSKYIDQLANKLSNKIVKNADKDLYLSAIIAKQDREKLANYLSLDPNKKETQFIIDRILNNSITQKHSKTFKELIDISDLTGIDINTLKKNQGRIPIKIGSNIKDFTQDKVFDNLSKTLQQDIVETIDDNAGVTDYIGDFLGGVGGGLGILTQMESFINSPGSNALDRDALKYARLVKGNKGDADKYKEEYAKKAFIRGIIYEVASKNHMRNGKHLRVSLNKKDLYEIRERIKERTKELFDNPDNFKYDKIRRMIVKIK